MDHNFSHLLSVFLRISDSPTPEKCCQREVCFLNSLSVFNGFPIIIVADNISDKTLNFVKNWAVVCKPTPKLIQTSLGNSGSLIKTLELACEADTMFAYFSEDDYIHRQDAGKLVVEGLRWSNYVTLYDHPDKYVKDRGYGEVGRCLKTESWHWRQTISTTETFGANLGLLRQDMDIFRKYCSGPVPQDHAQWCELAQKKRSLTVAIPGAAFNTHRVCEHSGFDWGFNWAVDQMKNVVKIYNANQPNVFQPPPDNVKFEPVEIRDPKGLPNLADMGRITNPVQMHHPKPIMAIPDPVSIHRQNLNTKKFEVVEGELGKFSTE
jgi:hypothetical protein